MLLRHTGRMNVVPSLDAALSALDSQSAMYAIHYASESFYEAQKAPMAISAIAVYDLRSKSTRTFSRTDTEGSSDEQESAMLGDYFSFLSANRDATFLHWNMGAMEFSFDALAKRYEYVSGEEPTPAAPVEQLNVDRMIRARHGEDYAPHARFESIGRLNDLDLRGFLPGASEAEAFKRERWGDVARSRLSRSS